MKIDETIKLVANNLWLYKKEKSYVDFRNALTSVAKEQQEITKQEMIEKVEKYMKENIHQDFVFYSNKGWSLRDKFIDDLKSVLKE